MDYVSFYLLESSDDHDRLLRDIWKYKRQVIESSHNIIQRVFPLNVESQHDRKAPILSDQDIETFKNNKDIQANIIKSLSWFLWSLGLKLSEDGTVVKESDFWLIKRSWLRLRNHNFLRITRVLTFLCLVGMEDQAMSFYNCLVEIYKESKFAIGETTMQYWKDAIKL